MASPEMIAAVSGALRGEEPPAAAPVVDPPAVDPPVTDPPAAAAEDLIGTPPVEEGSKEGVTAEPPAAEAGRVRDPATGKFVPKVVDPAEPASAAPAAPAVAPVAAAPAVPPKVVDAVNDPIPPNLKQETRERMTALVETVKAKDTELGATRADLDLLLTPINESGATVEQFREAMQLLKFINSPHQHEQQQALQYLQGAGSALAERLGVVPPGVDPLAGQQDLIEQVRANPAPRPSSVPLVSMKSHSVSKPPTSALMNLNASSMKRQPSCAS